MTGAKVAAFTVLVVASFGAFFLAQRLKNQPTVISTLRFETGGPGNVFSPNGDGRRDRFYVGFKVLEEDRVTVSMLDEAGDVVRRIVDDRPVGSYGWIRSAVWDGTDAQGRRAPDGRYRVRITLRDQGRSFVVPRSVLLDTTPPAPLVASIGPRPEYGPEILPSRGGRPARVRFRDPALICPQVRIYRTGPGRRVEVLRKTLRPGQTRWSWSGLLPVRKPRGGQNVCDVRDEAPAGRTEPAQSGTYVVVPEWRDVAGNIGRPVQVDRRGLPVFTARKWPGRGGVTVRRIGVQVPVVPARAGRRVVFGVDSRGRPYRWSMRLLGDSARSKRSTREKRKVLVKARAPGRRSGVYLFTASNSSASMTVPFAVQGSVPEGGEVGAPRGVLVLLPAITWAGTNPVDDDGDGQPNLLLRGNRVRLARVSARGVPTGFAAKEAPALIWLDRSRRRYDITTDAAIASGGGPRLSSYKGVLIPGDARWLPGVVRDRLRDFARGGGTVVSLGTDSLRRTVRFDRRKNTLRSPSRNRVVDLFGARLRPLVIDPTRLEHSEDDAKTVLFDGSDGSFETVGAYEQTIGLGSGKLLSSAVTVEPAGRVVIVAARYGRGRVIRTGLPGFPATLATGSDPAVTALMERLWVLLSR